MDARIVCFRPSEAGVELMTPRNFPEFDDGLHATTTSNFITHLPELNMDDLQTPPIPASLTSAVVPVVEESSLHYL